MPQEFTLQPSPLKTTSRDINALVPGYEAGEFVPNLNGDELYILRHGDFVKIGTFVHVEILISILTIGTGDRYTIFNLPFKCATDTTILSVGKFSIAATNVVSIIGYMLEGENKITLLSRSLPL